MVQVENMSANTLIKLGQTSGMLLESMLTQQKQQYEVHAKRV